MKLQFDWKHTTQQSSLWAANSNTHIQMFETNISIHTHTHTHTHTHAHTHTHKKTCKYNKVPCTDWHTQTYRTEAFSGACSVARYRVFQNTSTHKLVSLSKSASFSSLPLLCPMATSAVELQNNRKRLASSWRKTDFGIQKADEKLSDKSVLL